MGKKARKTRWRALEIAGESDSEESNTLSTQTSKSYGHRPYYSKFTYSSQSTPTRRYQHDAKSTRSSSTASETKITFNEDEYTKITTPRQDVLFKKGYLNKPKTYQTQTSTGNSTASTGNSTGNGTPDHQSADGTEGTDLEYESQFVFPNGFVDHHGVYYINSFEPYPLVMYNPPICYSEYPISRSKRHSTGSLTESTSPHNEEASQEFSQSGGETSGTVPEGNHVYNVVYPGYYYDGICGPNMVANSQVSTEPRKVRKKRRRRVSKNVPQDGSTSSDDYESSDEAVSQIENRTQAALENQDKSHENLRIRIEEVKEAQPTHDALTLDEKETKEERLCQDLPETDKRQPSETTEAPTSGDETKEIEEDSTSKDIRATTPDEGTKKLEDAHETCEIKEDVKEVVVQEEAQLSEDTIKQSKFNLNAEEFYPRAYRNPEQQQVNPNFHFVDMHHPNFIPLPFVNHHMNELGPPGFNPQFLPPGIPLGFMPHDPKLVPNFVNFVPNQFYPKPFEQPKTTSSGDNEETKVEDGPSPTKQEETPEVKEEVIEQVKLSPVVAKKTDVDIAKIVSKLEEAAKEQILQENQSKRHNFGRSPHKYNKLPRHRLSGSYNHSDSGYRSSYDRRDRRHYDRNRRSERPVEQTLDSKEVEVKDAPEEKPEEVTQQPEIPNTQPPAPVQPEIKTEPKEHKPEEIVSKENSRHSSPRHANYKSQYQSPRRFNYYNKNATPRTIAEVSHASTVNYSDTLKRQLTPRKPCPRYEKTVDRREIIVSSSTKKEEDTAPLKELVKPTKSSSQWISVSNRKKRKNKTANEEEFEIFNEDGTSTPSIDADVLILTKEEEIMINGENQSPASEDVPKRTTPIMQSTQIDTFIEMVVSKEASPMRIIPDTNEIFNGDTKIVVQDIQDVEKELLKELLQDEILIAEVEPLKEEFVTKTKPSTKKKSKKGVHKLCPKRIIIKDLDFSKDFIDVKPAEVPESPTISEVEPVAAVEKVEEQPEPVENIVKEIQDESTAHITLTDRDMITSDVITTSTPEKKKPKKKKKTPKPIITANQSASSSSTTLNVIDESYDFLLDTSVLVDDKTNVEVSQELDKMIQRGLYGNLEEKMKSLNVSINEDFFKSLSLDTKQSTSDKGFIKATDFSSILKNTNQILSKNKPESNTNTKIDIDFTKIKLPAGEPQPSTSKDCAFLELPQVKTENETPNTKSNGKLKNKSKKNLKVEKLPKNGEAPLVGLNKEDANDQANNEVEHYLNGGHLKNGNSDFHELSTEVQKDEEADSLLTTETTNNADEISSSGDENCQMPLGDSGIIVNAKATVEDEMVNGDKTINGDEDALDVTSNDDNSEEFQEDTTSINQEHIMQSTANPQHTQQPLIEDHQLTNGHPLTNGVHMKDLVPNSGHNEEDNDSDLPANNHNFSTKHQNGYKEIINFEERYMLTTDLPEEIDKICCKTYETFQVQDITEEEELKTNGFVQITLSACEDHKIDRKDSSGNVSDALEATDENITSDLTRPQKSITQAVFEWMTKTRENTPEVEILKSPDTINRELVNHGETDDESDVEEEITIFENCSPDQCCRTTKPEETANCNGVQKIEQGEDVLEVYESKYGKNEDFLKLKSEIEEHRKKGKHPKHGDLPYRAICCSLM